MMKSSIDIDTVKGFLDPKEGHALYSYALQVGCSWASAGSGQLLR